jgi:hypothetical protein
VSAAWGLLVGGLRLQEEISTGNRRPHHTEEVRDHESWNFGASPGHVVVKTLAIRLEEEQHAQLGMIAQLEELTVTDAIRQAIEQWITERRSNPALQARAEAVLADIERDASTRRGAIAALLGEDTSTKPPEGTTPIVRGRSSRAKGGDDASS